MKKITIILITIVVVVVCLVMGYSVANCDQEYIPIILVEKIEDINGFEHLFKIRYDNKNVYFKVEKTVYNKFNENDSAYLLIKINKISNKIFDREIVRSKNE